MPRIEALHHDDEPRQAAQRGSSFCPGQKESEQALDNQ